jgi:uncharacterized protein (TIGR00369 family)
MTERTRTITWGDPRAALEGAETRTGLEQLRRLRDGATPPPISVLMNMRGVAFEPGSAVFAADPAEYHYNPIGVVHGGFAATLLDSAMSCAVHTTLGVGERYTTLEIKVNFVRAITERTGRVRAEATVIHRGRTVATAEGRLVSEADGSLLAHGTTTCIVFPAPTASAG